MARPYLVDSHCHLDFAEFEPERDEIVARAGENGVGLMMTISTYVSRLPTLLALTERYQQVFASVGTHPLSVSAEPDVPTEDLIRLSQHPKIVAIGEAGLDYFYDRAPPEMQRAVFVRHIEAARETGLPLVIHARDADADMEAILTEETKRGAFPFVLHCFSSGRRLAEAGLELGGYVSFSGILTFNKSEEIRAIARDTPMERLLVETDAPYLAPPPHRGKRNEPAFVRHTAEVLAKVKDTDLDTIAAATTENFLRLFNRVSVERG
ncbi:TatD family hydrolase [Aureimonas ureilytica]|uniref:TatD family hydrolase n=1 Tax=Aureimonas ureilytica TaxID=401562 RepID=UPI00036F7F88|nr:TatD family hydrolase [Aureimonas ureilytica]